ncbi:MAG: hypothetical protein RL220_1885 [Bacteroidota bacterium]
MNRKLINGLVILSSLLGYLEWGGGQTAMLGALEYDLLLGSLRKAENFFHPMIILPLIGQVLLLVTILMKKAPRILTFLGLACLSVIMIMLLLISVLDFNWKILASVAPFFGFAIWSLRLHLARD